MAARAAVSLLAVCTVLLLAGRSAHYMVPRAELIGGLLPFKQDWSNRMQHESVHHDVHHGSGGHRIFAPLDEPVTRSITSDIPNMVDTAMEPTNNYEDKLNRKLLRLQREKAALAERRKDIIDGLTSDRDWQQRRAAAKAVDSHHQRLRDALQRARRRQWALYEKTVMSYAYAKKHSKFKADEYLKRRSRIMSRINELDGMLWDGDGQTTSEREKWHKEWAPYELSHSSSSGSTPSIDHTLNDVLGQAATLPNNDERKALLDKVKELHDVIKGGGMEKRMLTIPDKRSWRKMNTEYKDYSRHLTQREPLGGNEAWEWPEPKSSNFQWRHRDELVG